MSMSDLSLLIKELTEMIADTGSPIEVRAGHIVDDLMIRYVDIYENDPTFKAIGDMAIKIKESRATNGTNGVAWGEVIHLVHKMRDQ